MWIKRAILTNIGVHRRLEVNLERGLIGVFGGNGRGKSTFVDSLYAGISNDWGRFPGVKTDSINLAAGPREESSVFIEGEHNDIRFDLYRALRPPRSTPAHSLRIYDEDEITNADKISEVMAERLGVRTDLLGRYVFVPQWRMFDFLSETPATRAASYQLLCGTQRATEIGKAIDDMLKQDQDLTTDFVDNSDELRVNISQTEQSLMHTRNERAQFAKKLLTPEKVKRAKELQAMDREFNRLTGEHGKLINDIDDRRSKIVGIAQDVRRYEQEYAAAKTRTEATAKPAEEAKLTMRQLKDVKAKQAQKTKLDQQLAAAQAKLTAAQATPETGEIEDDSKLEEYREEYSINRAKVAELQGMIDTFANSDADFDAEPTTADKLCPTCGSSITEEHLGELQTQIAALTERQNFLEGRLKVITENRNKYWKRIEAIEQAEKDVTKFTEQLEVLGDVPTIEADEHKLNGVISRYSSAVSLQNDAKDALDKATNFHASLTAVQTRDDGRLLEIVASMRANKVDPVLLQKATEALDRHTTASAEVSVLDERIRNLNETLERGQTALERVSARAVRSRKAKQFGDRLRKMRDDVFHKQCLPQAVAQTNLEDMEADINAGLDSFGNPFWVEAAEDLSMTAHLPGMPGHSAQRLSGGQKMVLALAYRDAVQQLFDADIGMMALDEPTAGVDATNRKGLADALARLRDKVRGKQQVIIITHADELRHAFDQIIEL